jgi:hypothetical protein
MNHAKHMPWDEFLVFKCLQLQTHYELIANLLGHALSDRASLMGFRSYIRGLYWSRFTVWICDQTETSKRTLGAH